MRTHMRTFLVFMAATCVVCAALLVTNASAQGPARQGPTSSLKVSKVFIDTDGTPRNLIWQFLIRAHCTPAGPASQDMYVRPGDSWTLPVAAASTCSVTEPPQVNLNAVAHYPACNGGSASWTTSYSAQPVVIPSNATSTITVTNTLKCDPTFGSLKVIKTVVNTTGEKTLSSFPMTVSCTPSGPSNRALPVAPGATGATLPKIAANSSCTVNEGKLAPIPNVLGCKSSSGGGGASWTTTMSPAQPLTIVANTVVTLTITNTLKCDSK